LLLPRFFGVGLFTRGRSTTVRASSQSGKQVSRPSRTRGSRAAGAASIASGGPLGLCRSPNSLEVIRVERHCVRPARPSYRAMSAFSMRGTVIRGRESHATAATNDGGRGLEQGPRTHARATVLQMREEPPGTKPSVQPNARDFPARPAAPSPRHDSLQAPLPGHRRGWRLRGCD
jgi:hypothetical protein